MNRKELTHTQNRLQNWMIIILDANRLICFPLARCFFALNLSGAVEYEHHFSCWLPFSDNK